jgi:hypothetical protein
VPESSPLVPHGSTGCVSDDFWASLFPASLPPAPGLTAVSCSYGRGFATRFFQLHLAATPCVSLRLSSSTPSSSFRLDRFCPCWAHWDRPPGLSLAALAICRTHRSELTVIGHLSPREWDPVKATSAPSPSQREQEVYPLARNAIPSILTGGPEIQIRTAVRPAPNRKGLAPGRQPHRLQNSSSIDRRISRSSGAGLAVPKLPQMNTHAAFHSWHRVPGASEGGLTAIRASTMNCKPSLKLFPIRYRHSRRQFSFVGQIGQHPSHDSKRIKGRSSELRTARQGDAGPVDSAQVRNAFRAGRPSRSTNPAVRGHRRPKESETR